MEKFLKGGEKFMSENILAIPSKDRLKDESLQLLSVAGINVEIPGRQLAVEATLPEVGRFTVALMRPRDIIEWVGSGRIPLGIVGLDTLEEAKLMRPSFDSWKIQSAQALLKLGIGRCRLVAAAPVNSRMQSLKDLDEAAERNGALYIATSYPGITDKYLEDFRSRATRVVITRNLTGSVEAAPALGLANIITDLIETGTTLKDNNLREIGTIFESEAVLIAAMESDRRRDSFIGVIRRRLSSAIS